MQKKRVTLKDIAEQTNYSINTISRALKDKNDISVETRQFIKKVANEIGYIPDEVARSLRSQKTKTIGIVLGDISNPFFGIVVKGIEDYVRKKGYNVIISNTEENYQIEEESIRILISKRIDGLIILPTQKDNADIKLLQERNIPFVLLGRYFKELDTNYIVCDEEKGGYSATKHLIDKGHKKILVISGPSYISVAKDRLNGYIKALETSNIPVEENLIYKLNSVKGGECYKKFGGILKEKDFTAVFAFSDFLAFQVISSLESHGLKCPEDIAVVGYDNIQANSSLFIPKMLTTVSVPIYDMAQKAAKILLDRLDSSSKKQKYKQIIYDIKLLKRKTT